MKKQVKITAKSIDEAIAKAVEELGAPDVSDIEYTVIEEPKKGLFGIGAAPAKISAKAVIKGEKFALSFINIPLVYTAVIGNIALGVFVGGFKP